MKLLIPFLSLSTRIFARPDLLTYYLLPTYFVPTKLLLALLLRPVRRCRRSSTAAAGEATSCSVRMSLKRCLPFSPTLPPPATLVLVSQGLR